MATPPRLLPQSKPPGNAGAQFWIDDWVKWQQDFIALAMASLSSKALPPADEWVQWLEWIERHCVRLRVIPKLEPLAHEVSELDRRGKALVDPSEKRISQFYSPAEIEDRVASTIAGASEIARLIWDIDRIDVTAEQIQRWTKKGLLEERVGPNAEPWFALAEVRELVRAQRKARRRHADA